jgi:hypothetical protein
MSVSIKYPFPQYAKLFHNLGLKFVTSERGWIGYGLKRDIVEKKVPEEVQSWVSEYFSFYDSLVRLKQKTGTIVDQSAQDPKYVSWEQLTEEESLNACFQAQEESEIRKQILLQVKMDFTHPKIRIEQGGHGLSKESGILYIKGSMYTYHREGLNSLFHELSHFMTVSRERIKTGNLELKWAKHPKTFQGTMNELKVLALTETLSDYYQIERAERSHFLEAMAEHPDSELFFNAHMHLVSKFSPYSPEDEKEDKISYMWFTEKEGLSHEEAERQVKYISSQILHRKHKIQVLAAFFKTKLADKYTIDHIKFMFSQQLPFLEQP